MNLESLGLHTERGVPHKRKYSWAEERNILFYSNPHRIKLREENYGVGWVCPKCDGTHFEHDVTEGLECQDCVILWEAQTDGRYRPLVSLNFTLSTHMYYDRMWVCPVCEGVLGYNGKGPPDRVSCKSCRAAWQKQKSDGNPDSAYYAFAMSRTDLLLGLF